MSATILIADDDAAICTVLERAIRKRGYEVRITGDGEQLARWAEEGEGDLIITDVMMPVGGKASSSFEILPRIRASRPNLPVIVISAQNTLTTAVRANEHGAMDYLPKPFDLNALLDCVDRVLQSQQQETSAVLPRLPEEDTGLIGTSAAMQEIYRVLARVVALDLTVMISGESGTGKELVARALHLHSARRNNPFVAINMAAIPRELVESELFGHEKGAFTGAQARKTGKFEQAEGGTIFLDEIGDMPLDAQTKLLRVLQQGEFMPVGASRAIKTNVRIVCATHRDLAQHVQKGEFREDLYYRLNVVPLRVPPLRERAEDIPELVAYFLRRAQARGLPPKTLDKAAMEQLKAHGWPGNVRELENMIYRLCALCAENTITENHILNEWQDRKAEGQRTAQSLEQQVREHLERYFSAHDGNLPPNGLYDRILPLVEKPLIERSLQATDGNQLKAALLLGVNRNTLRKRMGELGIIPGKGDKA